MSEHKRAQLPRMAGGPVPARPLGERIRAALEGRILSGEWPPGHRIPSEHALMEQFACSRMTMNKVLSGMAAAGMIVRRRRAGSFVTTPRGDRAVLEIQDFATEAQRLGQVYRHRVLFRRVLRPDPARAAALGLPRAGEVLGVRCLHLMDATPTAYEDRLISLDAVPAARAERFRDTPPGTWLLRNVPWTEAEHVIRAANADARMRRALDLPAGAACLVLERRTWQQGALVTVVTLTWPGERHRFVGRFSPISGA